MIHRKGFKKIMVLPLIALLMAMTAIPMNSIIVHADTGDVEINEANFPDPAFRNYILLNIDRKAGLDGSGDGVLTPEEIESITELDNHFIELYGGGGKKVTSYKGIEYLTSLTRFRASTADLKDPTIDLSKNVEMEQLSLYDVELDDNYTDTNPTGTLKSIDISKMPRLKHLSIAGQKVSSLDLSNNKRLMTLNLSCNDNLTSIDISNQPLLTHVNFRYTPIKALDVSKNPELLNLEVSYCQLTDLDVSKNTKLGSLACNGNHLTTLDASAGTMTNEIGYNHNHQDLTTSPQSIEADKEKLDNGKWTVDMNKIVGAENLDKVAVTDGGTYDSTTGIVTYSSEPNTLTYEYDYNKDYTDYMQICNLKEHSVISGEHRDVNSMKVVAELKDIAANAQEEKEYTIKFDGNGSTGGTIPVDNNKYKKGDTVTVPKGLPTLDGYTFKCWKVNPEFQPGDKFVINDTLIAKADANNVITLKALWTEKKGSNTEDNTADTGDSRNIALCVVLLLTVALGATITIVMKRKQDRI